MTKDVFVDPDEIRDLTDNEEMYCQLRAQGFTKTQAANKVYETAHPSKMAYQLELRPSVVHRIWELKEELKEVSNITFDEQLRRYNALYLEAVKNSKFDMAKRILERMDKILGFESPTKTISIKSNSSEVFKDLKGDISKDVDKFKGILEKHAKSSPQTAENRPNKEADSLKNPKEVLH